MSLNYFVCCLLGAGMIISLLTGVFDLVAIILGGYDDYTIYTCLMKFGVFAAFCILLAFIIGSSGVAV